MVLDRTTDRRRGHGRGPTRRRRAAVFAARGDASPWCSWPAPADQRLPLGDRLEEGVPRSVDV